MNDEVVYGNCHLCEACCGLRYEVKDNRIVSVLPDEDHPLSTGYACPKGIAIAAVHDDPDRLRTPMRRTAEGGFEPVGWEDAFDEIAARFTTIRAQHGADSVAIYVGNPVVHDYAAALTRAGLIAAFGTRNCYSAGSQDTSPRFAASPTHSSV